MGFNDGKQTPLDNFSKYFFLTAPSAIKAATLSVSLFLIKKMFKWGYENISQDEWEDKLSEEIKKDPEFQKINEETPFNLYDKDGICKFVNNSLSSRGSYLGIAKAVGKTAGITGIGYLAGYGLAKLI